MKMRKINMDFAIGLFIIIIISCFFLIDGINAIQYQLISYDEGYNATVAANVMRYGEYRVSYPSHIYFYNMITTGETVILPTAILYKLFGINAITSAIIPVIYGMACIWGFWRLLASCLNENNNKGYTLSAILASLLILSDGLYIYISRRLIGEIAALFFIIISFIFLYHYFHRQKLTYIFFSGIMMAFSFLTKSSMIFFVVSCFGMVLAEMFLAKTIKYKHGVGYFIGFFTGFLFLDSYKLIQLGGVNNYLAWWKAEWSNMLNQSSGVDTSYSLLDKFRYLEEIFEGCNRYFCLIILILPVFIYVYHLYKTVVKRQINENYGILTMAMSGVGGASLICYFILLGGSGLVYARRHVVNELFVRLFCVYLIGIAIFYIRLLLTKGNSSENKIKKSTVLIILTGLLMVFVFPWNVIKSNAISYWEKDIDYAYNVQLMDEFLNELNQLPDDAVLYCAGWWQEPNVSLYLDKDMIDIYDVINSGSEVVNNGYFIVGNIINDISVSNIEDALNAELIRVDTSEVDYDKYFSKFDRKDFDLFSIYKIRILAYPTYTLGTDIYFSNDNNTGKVYVKRGFSTAESGFTWTNGHKASLWFTISDTSVNTCHIELNISGVFNDNQKVEISINGNLCYEGALFGEDTISFDFDNDNNGEVLMDIVLPDAISPLELGTGEDVRTLGLKIGSVMIEGK